MRRPRFISLLVVTASLLFGSAYSASSARADSYGLINASQTIGVKSGQILTIDAAGYSPNTTFQLAQCYFEMYDGYIWACAPAQKSVTSDAAGGFNTSFVARLTIAVPFSVSSIPIDCTEGIIGDTQCGVVAYNTDPIGTYTPVADFQGTQTPISVTSRYTTSEIGLVDAARLKQGWNYQRADSQMFSTGVVQYLLSISVATLPAPGVGNGPRVSTPWPAGQLELMTDVATAQHLTPAQFQKMSTLLVAYLILIS